MKITSTTTNDQGDVRTVYRNRQTGIAVIHTSAHRGGCLYIGTVTVVNQNTGAAFTFNSTAAPGEISETGAEQYAAKHLDKVA